MFREMNYRKTVKDGINTKDMEFRPLKEFIGQKIHVDGFFITHGKYGRQVVVVGNGYLINMPDRALETFETIQNDERKLDAVLSGHLVLKDIQPLDTKNGMTTSYTLDDC